VTCVSESGSICHEGDYKIVQQGNSRAATNGATSPADLNILMDLYESIRIDALTHSAMFSNAYPILLYGDVGASIHMANSATIPADMGLLFASDQSSAGTGTATFPMTSESASHGLIELKNFIAPVDSIVSGTCTDDLNDTLTTSAGTFTWTGQACSGGAHGGAGVSPTSPCRGSLTDPDGYQ